MDGVLFYEISLPYLLFRNGDAFHGVPSERWIRIGVASCDGVDYIHTFNDLPKDGIATIELRRWPKSDEELTTIRIWSGIRHRHNTFLIEG